MSWRSGSPCVAPRFCASKHASPELALLEEAASELACLDEFELLPASVVDAGCMMTPMTALPASPNMEDSEDESVHTPAWSKDPAQEDGGFVWSPMRSAPAAPVAPICTAVAPYGGYLPMWCWMQQTEDGQVLIAPFADGASEESPEHPCAGSHATFVKWWCWAQPNGQGGMLVVPCTEKGQQDEAAAKSGGAAAHAGADGGPAWGPPPAPPGAYVPVWVPGPCWPFNAVPTTLAVSNLPDDLTQEEFLEVLDREEFSGFYDFVFLPPAADQVHAQRRALVNLTKHAYALSLAAALHGRRAWGRDDRSRACEVHWSLPLQGLGELVRAYQNSPENHEDVEQSLRPQLFQSGWPAALPPAQYHGPAPDAGQ